MNVKALNLSPPPVQFLIQVSFKDIKKSQLRNQLAFFIENILV